MLAGNISNRELGPSSRCSRSVNAPSIISLFKSFNQQSYALFIFVVSYKILKIEVLVDFNWFPSSSGMLVNVAPSKSGSFNNLNFVNNKTQRFRWKDIKLLDYDSTSFLDMFEQNSVLRPWKEQLHASSHGAGRFEHRQENQSHCYWKQASVDQLS
ncbi:hypothetical protein V6N13_136954 [Hibiscus sabdariffa]